MRTFAFATIALYTFVAAARADCEHDINELKPLVSKVSDTHMRQVLQYDLESAHKEDLEDDEAECADALAHFRKIYQQNVKP